MLFGNARWAYDRYIEVTAERLYATIMQESDFALYELDVKESKDAEAQLKDEIKLALEKIVDEADESHFQNFLLLKFVPFVDKKR